MPTITFLPSGTTIEVKPGTSVFHAADRAGVAIASQCGGKCACALCRVKVVDGEDVVSPMRWEEEGHMGNAFFITRERLSCQLQVFGDVTIEVAEPEDRSGHKVRYVPHALLRKREEMERAADQADATQGHRSSPRPSPKGSPSKGSRGGSGSPSKGSRGAPKGSRGGSKGSRGAPKKSAGKPKKRKRSRNPGAPRRGDSRPPPGSKKKD